jgi:hypothetical protein
MAVLATASSQQHAAGGAKDVGSPRVAGAGSVVHGVEDQAPTDIHDLDIASAEGRVPGSLAISTSRREAPLVAAMSIP